VSTAANAGLPSRGRLGDQDKDVIGRARQLAGLSGPAAVRARYGTAAGARLYEISISGEAGDALRAAFDDCTMTIGPGLTTLRAQLPDQAALWSLLQRIADLGLELLALRLVAPA